MRYKRLSETRSAHQRRKVISEFPRSADVQIGNKCPLYLFVYVTAVGSAPTGPLTFRLLEKRHNGIHTISHRNDHGLL
jgi:hypothetical protein